MPKTTVCLRIWRKRRSMRRVASRLRRTALALQGTRPAPIARVGFEVGIECRLRSMEAFGKSDEAPLHAGLRPRVPISTLKTATGFDARIPSWALELVT